MACYPPPSWFSAVSSYDEGSGSDASSPLRTLIAAAAAIVLVAAGFRFTDDALSAAHRCSGPAVLHAIGLDAGCKGKKVAVDSGSLPPGLSSSVTRTRGRHLELADQGTPTQAGSWSFWLKATDICPS